MDGHDHGGATESRAIMRYILNKHSKVGGELLGDSVEAKGRVDQWLEVEAQVYNPLCSGIVAEVLFKPMFGGTTDDSKVKELTEKFEQVLDVYEQHLSKNGYLAGSFCSMADISHLPYTDRLFAAGQGSLIQSRKSLSAWWDKISNRSSWKKVASM
ncbi:hypothetical protein CBR_g16149 [Chara braunii]|uniref:glutathione transferase n=1 Tax=Chara braunii TaxID=69332 RepID=A0A388KU20_CHABU|nr:hypothetical protein CBR_g16149 [Chara braunii]|eukprot:GBG73433.1 hypothetical protein CBR_g16149 [Chara braunii]